MTKRIADLTCPECKKPIQVPFDVKEPPTLDQIISAVNEAVSDHATTDQLQKVIEDQFEGLKPKKEEHKHKTADEFIDCPECKAWLDKTAQKYKVVPAEQPKLGDQAQEPTPIGSIFTQKTED